jgi:hypothetical protein
MDIMEHKVEDIQELILSYLFDDKNKELWYTNKSVVINERFIPLLQGDWNRNKRKSRLNLNILLGERIKKIELLELIRTELKIKSCNGDYSMNINPNLLILFFSELHDIFKFEPIVDENDRLIGIMINNMNLRIETRKIFEIHSRFILNSCLLKVLGKLKFTEYFIKGGYIQYKIKDHLYCNKYIDMCYIVEGNNLLLEINEYHHSQISDKIRRKNILLNSTSRLVEYNTNDCYSNNDSIFEDMIKSLCKIIYKTQKSNSIKLYLIIINKMELSMINVGVSMYSNELNLKMSELLNLPFFDKSNLKIDIANIINMMVTRNNFNFRKDFVNKYDKEGVIMKLIKKKRHTEAMIQLLMDMDNIELTSYGIKNMLLSIDGNDWSRRNDYIEFMDELETKYYEVIEDILKDDDYDLLQEECKINDHIIGLLRYDQEKFFDKAESNGFHNMLHKTVPFIVKTKEKCYVDYDKLSNILSEEIKSKVKVIEFSNNRYIVNYRFMNCTELEEVYSNTNFPS